MALIVKTFEFGGLASAVLALIAVFMVKAISRRPEFDGLPDPPK